MSVSSKFAALCNEYHYQGRWPAGIEAACAELVHAVKTDPTAWDDLRPSDTLTAGHVLQSMEDYDNAALFLSRAYCDEGIRLSDEFLAFSDLDGEHWPKLSSAASCNKHGAVREILSRFFSKVFPSAAGRASGLAVDHTSGSSARASAARDPATTGTTLDSGVVIEYVGQRLVDFGMDNSRMHLCSQSAMWLAQRLLARTRAQPLVSEAAQANDEGPVFPQAASHFKSVFVDRSALPNPRVMSTVAADQAVEFALLAAVSVLRTKTLSELEHLAHSDPLWLASGECDDLLFEDVRSVPSPEIVNAVETERDRLAAKPLEPEVMRRKPLLIEQCLFELVCHADISAVDELELLHDRGAKYDHDRAAMLTILHVLVQFQAYVAAAVKDVFIEAELERCRCTAGAAAGGISVVFNCMKVSMVDAPSTLAIEAQNVLRKYPESRGVLLDLLRHFFRELSQAGETQARDAAGCALPSASVAATAGALPAPLSLRIHEINLVSPSYTMRRVASQFIATWAIKMSSTYILAHAKPLHAGCDLRDLGGQACRNLAHDLSRTMGLGPSLLLGIGGFRDNWDIEYRAWGLKRRWAHDLLLLEMPHVFEQNDGHNLLRLRPGQPPRICYFSEDPDSFAYHTRSLDARIKEMVGVEVVESSRLSLSPGRDES